MHRVSSNAANNDMMYHSRIREKRMTDLQNNMAEGSRIRELRDDPLAAAHSVKFKSALFRLERFEKNAESLQSELRIAEGYMEQANSIVHRVREIAVQGANGTYTASEKKIMGEEVNQLLNELVELANAKDASGRSVFAADRSTGNAFRVLEGAAPGVNGRIITGVQYIGGGQEKRIEISEGDTMEAVFPGNEVFWAENQHVFSARDASAYQVPADTAILVDGQQIELMQGDTVHAVMAKINGSGLAVEASLDPVTGAFTLRTTVPHQLLAEDAVGGTVLQDLGIISGNGYPPGNIHPDALVSGGSLFDMVMHLRDNLYAGDTLDIGGSSLKGITQAQDNLISAMAKIGSRDERLSTVLTRLNRQIPQTQEFDSKQTDIDLAEAIMQLKMLEYNHKAALQTAGRILQPTLLDFLR